MLLWASIEFSSSFVHSVRNNSDNSQNSVLQTLCVFLQDAGSSQVGFLLGSCSVSLALTSEICLKGLPKTPTGEILQFKGQILDQSSVFFISVSIVEKGKSSCSTCEGKRIFWKYQGLDLVVAGYCDGYGVYFIDILLMFIKDVDSEMCTTSSLWMFLWKNM